jgi:hypothetical protein
MEFPFKPPREGIFKSVALAHLILVLHVVLLAAVGLMVFFFGGLVQYMFWIFVGGALLLGVSAFFFYRRLKREGRSLAQSLNSPVFGGRSVEVSLLGGLATLKLGQPDNARQLTDAGRDSELRLEDPEVVRIREITALAEMLEKELITPEEFALAKQRLLGNGP